MTTRPLTISAAGRVLLRAFCVCIGWIMAIAAVVFVLCDQVREEAQGIGGRS